MKLVVEQDYEKVSKKAAQIIRDNINKNPNIVLGFATGSTPIGTYKELIRMHKEEGLDFSNVVTFNLDEYYGLDPKNNQSYHYFMYENLFKHINVKEENIHIPDGNVKDVEEFCREYEKEIENYGGIDLQLLGIGQNGHIGFNEPAVKLELNTHLTNLTPNTIKANSRFFESIDEVPVQAITMGIGTIMKSKKILLLANGENKAKVMGDLFNNKVITTNLPASLLYLHNDVTVIIDKKASKFIME